MDRYCDRREVSLEHYQLLGITSVFIAAKYEEISPPSIEALVDITAETYGREQILRQEYHTLQVLEFDITVPTVYRFIERFCSLIQADQVNLHLACYLGEIAMLKTSMYRWLPSRVASASIYLARRMLLRAERENSWPQTLQNNAGYTEREVRETARDICRCINVANRKRHYEPIFKKYRTNKFNNVSQIPV